MTKISEVIACIEQMAPLAYQESWDNSGVQVGDVSQEVKAVLLCVDITEATLNEAIERGANLVISHHPLIFKGIKKLTGRNYIERVIIKAIQHNIVLYSAHTNMDKCLGGVNFRIAQKLGLKNIRVLAPEENYLYKIVTYVPQSHIEQVRQAMWSAGAGTIGNYDCCSYSSEGNGTFRAQVGCNPFVGEMDKLHTEPELRLEMVVPKDKSGRVVAAIHTAHPYEEPAIDILPLANDYEQLGLGCIGELKQSITETAMLHYIKDKLNVQYIRHTQISDRLISRVALCGGSGAGKTFYEVKPNLMQMPHNCSFICTDPKGEILRSCGQMLKDNGYNVKVINLLEMDKSDCYNPFSYIREETDIVKLITNLIANTTPKGSTPSDPFWEKAEGLFLQAIFYYVWLEEKPSRRNFETVLQLLGEAEVTQQGKPSHLDVRMKFLEENNPLGPNHPAVKQYNKCMRGAGDTVRSIIISANSRLAFLENKQVLRLLSKDELNLADIGIGVNGDGETKTALFCVIPDSDKSYNFIIGMLYTQIFQELYYQADFNCGGRLPIHVTFMLDEFANVALPDDYCSLLSTMRSREISSIIIIQNFAQLKALFKDTWETVPGNCDTFIYLGGNEQSTHKYVSELLGKGTIDKKSSGETKGRQGSSSRNYDVLGRELFTPDEVRKLDNKKCIIFIRGFDPIMDNKYIPFAHPMFKQTADGGGKPYVHHMSSNNEVVGPPYEILSQKALEHYKQLKEKGENVYIDKLTYEEFMMIGDKELGWRFQMLDEQEQKDRFNAEQGQELEYSEESETTDKRKELPKIDGKDTILRRMAQWEFSDEQQEEAQKAMIVGVPENKILEYFYPDVEVEEMRQVREDYEKASA